MGAPENEFQTPEFQKLHDAMANLDMKFSKQTIYMRALEFAILYHCSGKQVPDDIAEIVPQYANYLNKAGCCKRESASAEPATDIQQAAQQVAQQLAQSSANGQPSANGQSSTNGRPITEEDLLSIISKDIAGR